MIEIKNKRLLFILIVLESLLLIPLIAMQFTSEVNWKFTDFVVFGFMLFVFGLVAELILRTIKKQNMRFFLIAFIVVLFLLSWAELAIGIFGSPIAGN